jgi:TRAP-type mannitol/chloroaromatic compound transport system permease small subunit
MKAERATLAAVAGAAIAAPAAHSRFEFPQTAISRAVDRVLMAISNAVSWIWVVMVVVITVNVIMRYVFGQGRIEFEELQWHLYSIGFLVGFAACVVSNTHVRIDVMYERFSPTTKAWIEFYGILLLLAPFIIVMVRYAIPFVAYSWSINERSEAPGGLPLRWAIKAVLLLAMLMFAVAAFSRLTRVCSYLFGSPRAVAGTSTECTS